VSRLATAGGSLPGAIAIHRSAPYNRAIDRETSGGVVAVRYATLPSTRRALFLRHESYGVADGPQDLAYYLWVIGDGPDALVVDTGFDPAVGARRRRTCLCPPIDALARLGVDPAAVSRVLVTHCHYDHVGNLAAFPNAEILVSARELEFWTTSPLARRGQFAEHVEAGEIEHLAEAHRSGRVRTIDGTAAIAPGVTAIDVGGHSPGQVVVTVETGDRPVVLTSDAVHLYEELERDRPFAIVADLSEMYRAYDTVRDLCERLHAPMVPGHDPAVMERFPRVQGPAAGLAVRVA
jgi:glyoxylase-like metal-dependent hydrolase (beta-lactamase superfamily II)